MNRKLLDRLRNRWAAFSHDLVMIPVAWLGAFWLRFNLETVPAVYLERALMVLPVVVVVQGFVFWYFGLYRGVWQFASLPDLVRILKAVVVGASFCAVAIFFLTRMQDVPRSVFPLHGLLLVLLLGGPRLVYRWVKEHQIYYRSDRKVLVVGAGQAGELLVRDLLRDRSYGYRPVAYVDDDPRKKGREIHGVRVLGKCDSIPRIVSDLAADLVLIAVPTATSRQMRRIVGLCEKAGVPFRTLPRLQDLVSGHSVLRELRDVSIEDLLGREPVSLDWDSMRRGIGGRTVLVSGGGGSIGAELCRQVAGLAPKRLVIVDSSEYNLYTIESELRASHPALPLVSMLGDVCDGVGIDRIVGEHEPDVIFHAAAYKHVPILEPQPREAVRNNVLGTRNVAVAAARHGTAAFVLISTDKAVNPANMLGRSKRVAEMLCQSMARRYPSTRFITVRFGNVLDSAGSVVPLFRRQIAAGGPVTVTHPEVCRYFMTIPESCQLILEAAVMGQGGEIFVLDMGEPVKIGYLAEQMIVLAGKTVGEDVEIVFTGLRPGEKLSEELFHPHESLVATDHDKILLARYGELDWNSLNASIEALIAACERHDERALAESLAGLVPGPAAVPAEREPAPAERGQSNVIAIDTVKR